MCWKIVVVACYLLLQISVFLEGDQFPSSPQKNPLWRLEYSYPSLHWTKQWISGNDGRSSQLLLWKLLYSNASSVGQVIPT